jgi:hypothetical protein
LAEAAGADFGSPMAAAMRASPPTSVQEPLPSG